MKRNFNFNLTAIRNFFSKTYSLVKIPKSHDCYMYFNTEYRQLSRSYDGGYLITVDNGFVKKKTR